MSPKTKTTVRWSLASVALADAFTDFMLSRQAMNATRNTLAFYRQTAGAFLSWLEGQSVTDPAQVLARHVRAYLAGLAAAGRADRTMHAHARAIKTLLRFWHKEGYLAGPVSFDMPKIAAKRLPRLTADQLRELLKICSVRDKAIVLLMADSGLRRSEVCALNWDDIDMATGAVIVQRGKGRKARVSRIGATTRRALLAYRRTMDNTNGALFLSRSGARLTGPGLLLVYRRLSKRTGIHCTPHAMRRTWTLLSLRAGMDPLHLQLLGGWAGLEMVQHYAALEDDDLLRAHAEHSPVDSL